LHVANQYLFAHIGGDLNLARHVSTGEGADVCLCPYRDIGQVHSSSTIADLQVAAVAEVDHLDHDLVGSLEPL